MKQLISMLLISATVCLFLLCIMVWWLFFFFFDTWMEILSPGRDLYGIIYSCCLDDTLKKGCDNKIWEYQIDVYEVMITFLLGFNALLGVVAFVSIKGKTEETAKEAAKKISEEVVTTYLKSQEFFNVTQRCVNEVFPDYGDFTDDVRQQLAKFEAEITRSNQKIKELEQNQEAIIETISYMDSSDNEKNNVSLTKKE